MVIGPDGSVLWKRMARDAADNASAGDLLAAVAP
jgi:hypothetical protein